MLNKLLTSTLLALGFLLFNITFPLHVLASEYGAGEYGAGEYNVGQASGPTTTTTSDAPECADTAPSGKTPWLYQANANDSNSVTLRFANWQNPTTHFALEYGIKSGEYQFGLDNFGNKETASFTVKSLVPNTTYFFRVRTGNGCATGDWSNEISIKTFGWFSFSKIEIIDMQIETEKDETEFSNCQSYTVKSGDTLWSIAQKLLGNGNKYQEIIEQNQDKYPSLENSNSISNGWELRINCSQETQEVEGGYDVRVKVVDTNEKPVEGAKVTLHSKVQEATTDKDGVAKFSNVEPGDHRVIIAYKGYEGEQSLNLSGDVKEFNLNITIEPKRVIFSPVSLGVISALAIALAAMIVIFIKNRK